MSMTLFAAVFAIALLSCLAVLARFTQKKAIEEPLKEGRARGSVVVEFVDDLQKHRWPVIVAIAVLVALEKSYHFSGGLLESRWVIGLVITALFAGRLLLRRLPRKRGRVRNSGSGFTAVGLISQLPDVATEPKMAVMSSSTLVLTSLIGLSLLRAQNVPGPQRNPFDAIPEPVVSPAPKVSGPNIAAIEFRGATRGRSRCCVC